MIAIKTHTAFAALAAALLVSGAAQAQTPYGQPYGGQTQSRPQSQQEVFGAILGALFGQQGGTPDSEWQRGRRPLGAGAAQFDTRLQAEVRSGALSRTAADRLRGEYDALVQLETRYGADGRFTSQERADLNSRYAALSQSLEAGGYGDDLGGYASVADGRSEFEARIDAAVRARSLTRVQATRLRADYQALIQLEAEYQRNGLTVREREDLETRLDALDARVGDTPGYGGGYQQDPRTRLAAIERALSAPGVGRAEAAQIAVEHGDLVRLEAAYARTTPTADDRAYLDRRIGELEVRARIRR
jgi:hypothetical protein